MGERQARPLATVLKTEGEKAVVEVVREVEARHGDDATATDIALVVDGRKQATRRPRMTNPVRSGKEAFREWRDASKNWLRASQKMWDVPPVPNDHVHVEMSLLEVGGWLMEFQDLYGFGDKKTGLNDEVTAWGKLVARRASKAPSEVEGNARRLAKSLALIGEAGASSWSPSEALRVWNALNDLSEVIEGALTEAHDRSGRET